MKKGFTLIELSIVLIAMGMMTAGLLTLLKSFNDKKLYEENKVLLESAKKTVLTFAVENKRLPTEIEFAQLNFKSFGTKDLKYFTDPSLETNICSNYMANISTISPNNITKTNIAFVITSSGANMKIQTQKVNNVITFKEWNSKEGTILYDDVSTQMNLNELKVDIDCDDLRIINPELHIGSEGIPYLAQIVANGGTGVYNFSIDSNVNDITIDSSTGQLSWNNPINGTYPLTVTANSGSFNPTSKKFVLVIDGYNGNNNNNNGNGNNGNGNNGNHNGNDNGNNGNHNGNDNGNNGNHNGNNGNGH